MTNATVLGVLALLLTLVGCAAPSESAFHGDVSFSLEERVVIEHANVWLAATLGEVPFEIVWDLPHPSDDAEAPRTDSSPHTIRRGPAPGQPADSIGWTRNRHAVSIRIGVGEDPLDVVAAHEFGHVRGLEHHAGPGLMSPYGETTLAWTAEDAASRQ